MYRAGIDKRREIEGSAGATPLEREREPVVVERNRKRAA